MHFGPRIRIAIRLLLLFVLVSGTEAVIVPSASASGCIEDGWLFPYKPGGDSAYGDMGVILTVDNAGRCSGGGIHHTIYERVSDNYHYYVEDGYEQRSGGSYWFYWAQHDEVFCPNECFTEPGSFTNQWNSFNVVSSGTPTCCHTATWDMQFAQNANENNWSSLGVTETMPTNVGLPESEISWYGTSTEANDQHDNLKYRPSGGGWLTWNAMGCDYNSTGSDLRGWSAYFASTHDAWSSAHNLSGDCHNAQQF